MTDRVPPQGRVDASKIAERGMSPGGIVLTPQQQRSRRNRNIAIGLAVAFFVLLFYVVTIAKLMPVAPRVPT